MPWRQLQGNRSMPFDANDEALFRKAIEAAIRIGLIALLMLWCYQIVAPFIPPVVWGVVMAVAVHPLYLRLCTAVGGREKLAAATVTVLALALLVAPTVMLSGTLVQGVTWLAEALSAGTLAVPPPPDGIREWPLVGERLHQFWNLASTNLAGALGQLEPQLEDFSRWLLKKAAGAGIGVLQFVLSIAIAGLLLANAASGQRAAEAVATRLTGERGRGIARLAAATVRSVAQGVLGVAVIQALLAGVGLLAANVPGAGLWALLVLLLAVVQLPPILILAPIIVYVFSVAGTVTAVLFLIWSVAVSMSDAVLKPLLLGRGLDIPMLVILVGAIGGMMTAGIVGLFVGSVILALGYTLFVAWLEQGHARPEVAPAEE
jgi:predicted PurR-regulated permease PerM